MLNEYPAYKILSSLSRDNLLPAILFRTSRKQCDQDIEKLAESSKNHLPTETTQALAKEISKIAERSNFDLLVITSHSQYHSLILTGTGAHHAGQLFVWRLLLEELMSKGLLRLLVATGTVAAGVDFPARTVVITAHSKRSNDGFATLSSSELMQMAGRAGRRGKDAVGICLIAPGHFSDARVLADVAKRPPLPLRSAYFAAPATILNLLRWRNVDDLKYTIARSLASFLDLRSANNIRKTALRVSPHPHSLERRERKQEREANLIEKRQERNLELALTGLERLGYLEGTALSEKGTWAANLCTSLVLEFAEAISSGLFDDLTPTHLAGIVASVSADPHRDYFNLKPNPIKKELFKAFEKILYKVKDAYQHPTNSEVEIVPDAALTVMHWIEARNWGEFSPLLKLARIAEGDVARLVNQTADNLNQIARLRDTHPEIAESASQARLSLLRPPISDGM
jgi:superfamily II RNA helicase